MLIYTAFLLGKIAFKEFNIKFFPVIIVSAIISFVFNIAIGFLIGLILYYIFERLIGKTDH